MRCDRYLALSDEYDDLLEEYFDCDDHDERCRCAVRMNQIVSEQLPEVEQPLIE